MLSLARAATSTTPQWPCRRRGRGGRSICPLLIKQLLCVGTKSSLIGAITKKYFLDQQEFEGIKGSIWYYDPELKR